MQVSLTYDGVEAVGEELLATSKMAAQVDAFPQHLKEPRTARRLGRGHVWHGDSSRGGFGCGCASGRVRPLSAFVGLARGLVCGRGRGVCCGGGDRHVIVSRDVRVIAPGIGRHRHRVHGHGGDGGVGRWGGSGEWRSGEPVGLRWRKARVYMGRAAACKM